MATRSLSRRDLHLRPGSQLPPLLHQHPRPHSRYLARPLPVSNQDILNKPSGGAWAAPALVPYGRWRPVLHHSTWSKYLEYLHPERAEPGADLGYHTQVIPESGTTFAVIDSAADAVALHAAFPLTEHPLFEANRAMPGTWDGLFGPVIDWVTLAESGLSGVYLTARGQHAVRNPTERATVPRMPTWDVASVWFAGRAAYRTGRRRPCRLIHADEAEPVLPNGLTFADWFTQNRDRLIEAMEELWPGSTTELATAEPQD